MAEVSPTVKTSDQCCCDQGPQKQKAEEGTAMNLLHEGLGTWKQSEINRPVVPPPKTFPKEQKALSSARSDKYN